MTQASKWNETVCAALGRFVWYYPAPQDTQLLTAPRPRSDGLPFDATIIGVNSDGTVSIRAWDEGSIPHGISNVPLYDGKLLPGGAVVVYPEDDDGRLKQIADKAKFDADAAAKQVAAAAKAEAKK